MKFRTCFELKENHQYEDKIKVSVREAPYHIMIIPNRVGYTLIVICDICANEKKDFSEY